MSKMQNRIGQDQPDQEQDTSIPERDLDVILHIPVELTVEVGSVEMTVEAVTRLNQGAIVPLDKPAGEPLDVLVNGTLVAQGEVVVVNEKFGIRLTDIVSKAERIKRLR